MLLKAPTAASGLRKDGMLALARISRASSWSSLPMVQLISGLGVLARASASTCASAAALHEGLGL